MLLVVPEAVVHAATSVLAAATAASIPHRAPSDGGRCGRTKVEINLVDLQGVITSRLRPTNTLNGPWLLNV
jgi:hypothetical protein